MATDDPDESLAPGDTVSVSATVATTGGGAVTGVVGSFEVPSGLSADTTTVDVGDVEERAAFSADLTATAAGVHSVTVDVTADGLAGDTDLLTVVVEDDAGSPGLSRFDLDGDGQIEAREVLTAIEAYNDDTTIGGRPVEVRDVLRVISAYNAGVRV